MLQITETVEFNEELYNKNIEENEFAEIDDEVGEDNVEDNQG